MGDTRFHAAWDYLAPHVHPEDSLRLVSTMRLFAVLCLLGLAHGSNSTVCLGNALMMQGKADILAVVHDTGCKLGIGGVSAINNFYGHNDIVLGAWKGQFGSDCNQHYAGTSGQNQYLSTII